MNIDSSKIIVIMILFAIALSSVYYFQYIELRADYEMEKYVVRDKQVSYDLFSPSIRYELPEKLMEISGLTYVESNKIGCVQDEKGTLYIYDLLREDIAREIDFEEGGDYEGVEVVGNDFYALESNGHIYKFPVTQNEQIKSEKIKTNLQGKNDTEGLGYLPEKNLLLIACKESGDSKEVNVKGKAIYLYDIKNRKFLEEPLFNFSDEYIESSLEQFELKKNHAPFKPSGIAVHPETGSIYIISSAAKLLIVCDEKGIIHQMIPMDAGIFRQPEGICFSPDGKLYISNEGKGGEGNILLFDPE